MAEYFPIASSAETGGVGVGAIGEMTIGTEPFTWEQTIQAQFANSPTTLQLIDFIAQNIDPTQIIDEWYDNLWNIQTAVGYGLDVWGRIVVIPRTIVGIVQPYLGFKEANDAARTPWNQAPWYAGEPMTNTNYVMPDTLYRRVILAKAAANIWNGSIASLNAILRMLYPNQIAYVVDNQDMTMQYVFGFQLGVVDQAVLSLPGLLPKPVGVYATVVQKV